MYNFMLECQIRLVLRGISTGLSDDFKIIMNIQEIIYVKLISVLKKITNEKDKSRNSRE